MNLNTIKSYAYYKVLAINLCLGYVSGLPLALTAGTFQAWLTFENIDIQTIGWLSLVGLPYTLKFLWASWLDSKLLPFLTRRRAWLVVTQIVVAGLVFAISLCSPSASESQLLIASGLTVLLAFASATFDINSDAYRTELLQQDKNQHLKGLSSSLAVLGYRFAMLTSGGGTLILTHYFDWSMIYQIMSALTLFGLIIILWADEDKLNLEKQQEIQQSNFFSILKEAFQEYFSRDKAVVILCLIISYKLANVFAEALSTVFLYRGIGFEMAEIGAIKKGVGIIATIAGTMLGGLIMLRISLYKAMLYFGFIQVLSNLSYLMLTFTGKSFALMTSAVIFENIGSGMGSSAFAGFIISLCNTRFTATQFALLSALATLGRVWVGPVAGYLQPLLGWTNYFILSIIIGIPSLILLIYLRKILENKL